MIWNAPRRKARSVSVSGTGTQIRRELANRCSCRDAPELAAKLPLLVLPRLIPRAGNLTRATSFAVRRAL